MDNILDSLCLSVCGAGSYDEDTGPLMEKHHISGTYTTTTTRTRTPDEIATDVVARLRDAEKNGRQLTVDLNNMLIRTNLGSWASSVAKAILNKLVQLLLLNDTAKMGNAIRDALAKVDKIAQEIYDFARDHPVAIEVFCTILAIGVLWFMLPWVLEVLGFAAEGPLAESFAAWWEALYAGYIPKGSLFSFFQRLAMKWPRV